MLAETSAEGGETLKVCWSCVDLPRPLETQTIFSSLPATRSWFSFLFCSVFLYFSYGRPVSGETDEDDTESFVAKAYDRCFSCFHQHLRPSQNCEVQQFCKVVCLTGLDDQGQSSAQQEARKLWLKLTFCQISVNSWTVFTCFHFDVIKYWFRMSWLFGLMQIQVSLLKGLSARSWVSLTLSLEPGAFRVCGLCVWLTEAHPNLISYKQSFLEDGGMLFIIMTLAEAVPHTHFRKRKAGIFERRILSHGQMLRTTDPHTAPVQRNLTAWRPACII